MSSSFSRYPKPRLRPFMLEVFSAWNCRTESGSGVIEVDLNPALQKRFGVKKLRLLLSRTSRPSKNSGELMVPGNPTYRGVLDLAREKGGVGRGYVPLPKARPAASTVARSVRRTVGLDGGSYRSVIRGEIYHPILLFHFNLSYGAPEVPDEIRTVAWDVVADEAVDPAPFSPGEVSLEATPRKGLSQTQPGAIEGLFPRVQAAIEAQISKKVARTEARAGKQLEKEGARIEDFYRRMIAEEKSRPKSRNGGDPERSRKIKLYQLDWKRKLTEATERLKPRINVRLFCIEEIYVPRRKTALIVPGCVMPEKECFYDYLSKEVLGPACDVCGARSTQVSICQSGHLCCSGCASVCRVCERTFCQQCWSERWDDKLKEGRKGADPSIVAEMDPDCAFEAENRRRGSSR